MRRVIAEKKDEVHMIISCEDGTAHELRDYFTFMVPGYQFMPKFRNKMWDGKIRLFNTLKRELYLGLLPHLSIFCEMYNYELVLGEKLSKKREHLKEDEFIKKLKLDQVDLEPRDYQIKGFKYGIEHKRGILVSPTASGKSLMIYMLWRWFYSQKKRVLLVVPTQQLVEQMYKDILGYIPDGNLKNPEDKICKIYSGVKKHVGQKKSGVNVLTISTWQSLHRRPQSFFDNFDAIIGDEAHTFQAKSLIGMMEKMKNVEYKIGTTGTLQDTKVHKLVLEGLFGNVHELTSSSELMERGMIAQLDIKAIMLKYSDKERIEMFKSKYHDEMEFLISHEKRSRFISKLARSLEGNSLILFQFVEKHGIPMYEEVREVIKSSDPDRSVYLIHGAVNADVREDIRMKMEKENNAVLIASYGTLSTGVNIKNIHNVIFASPSKSKIRNLQSIGRGLRLSSSKSKMTLYDIGDDLSEKVKNKKHAWVNHTLKHFSERLALYSNEDFEYKLFKVDLTNDVKGTSTATKRKRNNNPNS